MDNFEEAINAMERLYNKDITEPLSDYKTIINNINNNIIDVRYNNYLYNKYKHEIQFINQLRIKNNNKHNQITNVYDINDLKISNQMISDLLFRVIIMRIVKEKYKEEMAYCDLNILYKYIINLL